MSYLLDHARAAGELTSAYYRVVVDQDGRITAHDFDDLETARQYANDAASEYGDAPMLAIVVDSDFNVVHEGRPYCAK